MSNIPMKGVGPKYINKSVMVDGAVWDELIKRRVNMSELVRNALDEALRTLTSRESPVASNESRSTKARR